MGFSGGGSLMEAFGLAVVGVDEDVMESRDEDLHA
jgi:hypothetical protein